MCSNRNNKSFEFRGVYVPMVTIFNKDEEIDYGRIKEHVEYLISSGVNGIISNAATSEFFSLSMEERKKVAKTVVEQVNGRIPVWDGTAACATKDVIELSKHAEYIGANGVMIIPHYYVPLSEEETYFHYKLIDKEINIPIIVYNCPLVSYVNISADLLLKIKSVTKNIKYVKDSSNSLSNIQEILQKTNFQVGVFCGEEPIYLEALYAGCIGIIPLLANGIPEIFTEMVKLINNNKFIELRNLHYKYLPILNLVLGKYCSISTVKLISKLRKRDIGLARMPIMQLPIEEEKKVVALLKDCEVI